MVPEKLFSSSIREQENEETSVWSEDRLHSSKIILKTFLFILLCEILFPICIWFGLALLNIFIYVVISCSYWQKYVIDSLV